LVAELSTQIVDTIAPESIFIIGLSIGGHLPYVMALLLKKQLREVA